MKNLKVIVNIGIVALSTVCMAQNQNNAVALHRIPPTSTAQSAQPTKLKDYQFSEALAALKGNGPSPLLAAMPPFLNQTDQPPSTWNGSKDVELSDTARAAVKLSKQLVGETNTPTQTNDGRIVYTYGVGMPTMVCAPLRVCSLELQPGEKIQGEPEIGDSVRWEVTPALVGSGAYATPVLVVKPRGVGLDTTMIVLTDRRTYYVRLVSKSDEYVARTSFAYSDDEHVQWKMFLEQQEKERQARLASSQVAKTATASVDKLNFDYEIKTKRFGATIRPDRVLYDGEKTYIQMPQSTLHRELPTLVIQGPAGDEMVNFRVRDNTYVIDRLFDRAALIIGTGNKQEIVRITRRQSLTKIAQIGEGR